jgi:tRNA modification GTPase
MMLEDTIAAIATPLGEGGLAVIRVSGAEALGVVDRCFKPARRRASGLGGVATHTIHYGHIVSAGRVVDEVLVSVMRAPRTFTREDVVEVSCHGGVLAARLVLEAVLAAGARLAEPGEFTQRAFLNGRLDLAQAEAVVDVIRARTDAALVAATEQLAGKLSRRVEELREDLMGVLAHVEAHLDFPEEDIEPDTVDQLGARIESGASVMEELLRTAREGQILRNGIRVVLMGRPNAGKSSLLNQLVGHDRAIVSTVPGTTRDTIEATTNVRGMPVVFIDTAGFREPGDELEREGVRRSEVSVERADLVLHVVDASGPWSDEDVQQAGRLAGRPWVLVRNKMDLPCRLGVGGLTGVPAVDVCALSGQGVESLKDTIQRMVWGGEIRAEMLEVTINARHRDALWRARESVVRAGVALRAGVPLEVVAMDLRAGVQAVGEVVGKTTTEDLLDRIFGQFCLGK